MASTKTLGANRHAKRAREVKLQPAARPRVTPFVQVASTARPPVPRALRDPTARRDPRARTRALLATTAPRPASLRAP